MNEKTEATTATFLQTLRELSESRKTGTAMGSTNENRFLGYACRKASLHILSMDENMV